MSPPKIAADPGKDVLDAAPDIFNGCHRLDRHAW
jgi:hypothetical protein